MAGDEVRVGGDGARDDPAGDDLLRGREAFAARAWARAAAELARADAADDLDVDDLDRLALASYLSGDDDTYAAVTERCVQRRLDAGDRRGAAREAFWLALHLFLRGDTAQGGGWIGRAHRALADGGDAECAEQGLLLSAAALQALYSGDPDQAAEVFGRVLDIGTRCGDPDVTALGVLGSGQAEVARGHREEGLSLLDEAMVAVTADDVSPVTTGVAYCAVVETCHLAFDLHRAREWTGVLARWCADQPELVPFRGQCLVHRAQVLALEGDWAAAITEMERARERLADPPGQPAVGMAWYHSGDLLRLQGRHHDAEECFRRASAFGHPAHPGLFLLRLAEGRSDDALAAVDAALATAPPGGHRWRLLAAASEVCRACGDADAARRAVDELDEATGGATGGRAGTWLQAIAATAAGGVLLAEGRPREAGPVLRQAWEAWRELRVPYEAARTRVLLGEVCAALGDADGAVLEWDAARLVFDDLGALDDLAAVQARISPEPPGRPSGLTPREVEVLRLVAKGRTNREIADALVLSEHTVRRHLQNVFARLGVSSRAAAAAFAVQHDLV